ncbi:MAG: hypothetical protein HW398_643, partial [Acidobacteria bacterium]|nr:hypothetical protein [Acidobacteriota bacterium]
VEEQQGRQVLDLIAPPEFLARRAAEVHVEKQDLLSPLSFEPMHDGPRRLAAQSEIGIEVQQADAARTQLRSEVVG